MISRTVPGVPETSDQKNEVHSPGQPTKLDLRMDQSRSSRVGEITKHLQAYERIEELSHERYQIEVDTTSMRTRMATLGQSAAHTTRANEAFDAALGRVYRNPQLAHDHFMTAAEQRGIAHATRTMHERPEQFGALVSIEQTRAFGLTRTNDDATARVAAILAARVGHLAWEASNALQVEVARARATRTEDEISSSLGALYEKPVRARAAFDHLSIEHGAAEALHVTGAGLLLLVCAAARRLLLSEGRVGKRNRQQGESQKISTHRVPSF